MQGIRDLSSEFKHLNSVGVSLNLDETMNLELSLIKLHELEDFEEVLFWGKISGVAKDYFIAMTLKYKGSYEFPLKRYFWCTNADWVFSELPNINVNDREHAEAINTVFSGSPDKIIYEAVKEDEDAAEPV
jgi:radial spoke head protein 9